MILSLHRPQPQQEEEEPHADRSVSKEGHLSGWVVYSTNRKAIVTCGPRTFGRAPNMADIEERRSS